jgi:hypothetical protein
MNKFSFKTSFSKKTKTKADPVKENEEQAQEIKSNFIQGITDKQKKFQQDTDMEFFVCIAFQNREQKEDFIKQKGWDKLGDKYYAGVDIAEIEGVNLQIDNNMRKQFKFKPRKTI